MSSFDSPVNKLGAFDYSALRADYRERNPEQLPWNQCISYSCDANATAQNRLAFACLPVNWPVSSQFVRGPIGFGPPHTALWAARGAAHGSDRGTQSGGGAPFFRNRERWIDRSGMPLTRLRLRCVLRRAVLGGGNRNRW